MDINLRVKEGFFHKKIHKQLWKISKNVFLKNLHIGYRHRWTLIKLTRNDWYKLFFPQENPQVIIKNIRKYTLQKLSIRYINITGQKLYWIVMIYTWDKT